MFCSCFVSQKRCKGTAFFYIRKCLKIFFSNSFLFDSLFHCKLDHYHRFFFHSQQRNFNVKQLPFPISLLAEILPPCKFMICLHKLSPMPLPVGFVVKKGTKILSKTSGRIPLPLSQTERKNKCFSGSPCVLTDRKSTRLNSSHLA